MKPKESIEYWEKIQLQPFSPKKTFFYYVLHPNNFSHFQGIIKDYFKELSCIYEVCNLGIHKPFYNPNYPNGFIPVPFDLPFHQSPTPTSSSTSFNRSTASPEPPNQSHSPPIHDEFIDFFKFCSKLKTEISSHKLFSDNCLVIYLLNPFLYTTSRFDLLKCLSVIYSGLSSKQNIVFQIIPFEHVFNYQRNSMNVLKEIAFSVFNKCRRISYNHPTQSHPPIPTFNHPLSSVTNKSNPAHSNLHQNTNIYRLYEPLFILSTQPNRSFHCGYTRSFDNKWIVMVFTDNKGELLEQRSIPIPPPSSPPLSLSSSTTSPSLPSSTDHSFDPSVVWENCCTLLRNLPVRFTSIVVGKFGLFHLSEYEGKLYSFLIFLSQVILPDIREKYYRNSSDFSDNNILIIIHRLIFTCSKMQKNGRN